MFQQNRTAAIPGRRDCRLPEQFPPGSHQAGFGAGSAQVDADESAFGINGAMPAVNGRNEFLSDDLRTRDRSSYDDGKSPGAERLPNLIGGLDSPLSDDRNACGADQIGDEGRLKSGHVPSVGGIPPQRRENGIRAGFRSLSRLLERGNIGEDRDSKFTPDAPQPIKRTEVLAASRAIECDQSGPCFQQFPGPVDRRSDKNLAVELHLLPDAHDGKIHCLTNGPHVLRPIGPNSPGPAFHCSPRKSRHAGGITKRAGFESLAGHDQSAAKLIK